MASTDDDRINRMFSGDRFSALIALLTLWATYVFVFFEVLPLTGDNNVLYVLAAGAGFVLLFNTAAIIAMLSHYAEDKQHIYGLDLHYLDLMNTPKD